MLSLDVLVDAGFKRSAYWELDATGKPQVADTLPKVPGIYLFAVRSRINYIGKADRSLQSRIRRYVGTMRGAERPRPVHAGIDEALRKGDRVCIYTFSAIDPRIYQWKGLPLDRLIGLEAGLIEELNPKWNPYNAIGRGRRASVEVND